MCVRACVRASECACVCACMCSLSVLGNGWHFWSSSFSATFFRNSYPTPGHIPEPVWSLDPCGDDFRAAPDAATRHVPRTVTCRDVASPRVRFNIKTGSSLFAQSKTKRERGLLQVATWNAGSLLNFSAPVETAFGGFQWIAISSRLIIAKLWMAKVDGESTWLDVIVCYAPTFRAPRLMKDNFH